MSVIICFLPFFVALLQGFSTIVTQNCTLRPIVSVFPFVVRRPKNALKLQSSRACVCGFLQPETYFKCKFSVHYTA